MKVAVINFSGNVGKSTIARHVLTPRIPDAQFFSVETINSDGTDIESIKANQYRELIEALMVLDAAVVDVGASNIEGVVKLMKQYDGSHDFFDYFVVPVVPAKKQQRDTISTIAELNEIGIPANKIRVVFNNVEPENDYLQTFEPIIKYYETAKHFKLTPAAVLYSNEVYGLIKDTNATVLDVVNDQTDYKALLKDAKDQDEKLGFAHKLSIKLLAGGVAKQHDAVFKALFK